MWAVDVYRAELWAVSHEQKRDSTASRMLLTLCGDGEAGQTPCGLYEVASQKVAAYTDDAVEVVITPADTALSSSNAVPSDGEALYLL